MTKTKKGTKRTRKEFEEGEEPYQARCWDFTLNNYTPDECLHIQTVAEFRFCGFGKEIAPSTGTPHLQGMVCFKNAKTRAGVVAVIGARISCRPLYSSEEKLLEYCEKGGDWWEKGERPVSKEDQGLQGKARTVDILRLAKAGQFDELEALYPEAWFYQQRAIMSARSHTLRNNVPLDGILENYWIFGDSGVGKGMYIDTVAKAPYIKAASTKWWCGYAGEDDVVLDDMDAAIIPLLGEFKLWTCRKPFNAEVKGGNWLIRPKRIFVTSQWSPTRLFKAHPEHLAAIMRRFQIIEIERDGTCTAFERVHTEKPVLKPLVYVNYPCP